MPWKSSAAAMVFALVACSSPITCWPPAPAAGSADEFHGARVDSGFEASDVFDAGQPTIAVSAPGDALAPPCAYANGSVHDLDLPDGGHEDVFVDGGPVVADDRPCRRTAALLSELQNDRAEILYDDLRTDAQPDGGLGVTITFHDWADADRIVEDVGDVLLEHGLGGPVDVQAADQMFQCL